MRPRTLVLCDGLAFDVGRRLGQEWCGPVTLHGGRFAYVERDAYAAFVAQPYEAQDGSTWLQLDVIHAGGPIEVHVLAGELFGPHARVYELIRIGPGPGPHRMMIWGRLPGGRLP